MNHILWLFLAALHKAAPVQGIAHMAAARKAHAKFRIDSFMSLLNVFLLFKNPDEKFPNLKYQLLIAFWPTP